MPTANYQSCFLAYGNEDEAFARKFYDFLKAAGLTVWFAPEAMAGGEKMHVQVYKAIGEHDRLLLVLSPHSINSEWVKTEIYQAHKRERREQRRILFPVSLMDYDALLDWEYFDGDTGKDLAREVREYYIPDFSNWQDTVAFDNRFARLLRDLKA